MKSRVFWLIMFPLLFRVLEVVFSFSINWFRLLLGFFFYHLLCYYLSLRR